MELVNGNAWVALGNSDSSAFTPSGPGYLAAVVPSTGHTDKVNLGGSGGQQCKNAGFVRAAEGKLYVTCGGDFRDGSGTAIVEVDPGTDPSKASVTRSVKVTTSPAGVAVASTRIWFGDAYAGKVYAIDKTSFTVVGAPVSIQCPAAGYATTNDVAIIGGDLYAICSNDSGGTLSRLEAATGVLKGTAEIGPVAAELTQTSDGRIAVISGSDNKVRLVTIGSSTLTVEVALTLSQAQTLQDVRARDQFLFTVSSFTNTVQKIDLAASGGPKLVAEVNVGDKANPWNLLPLDDDQAIVSNLMTNVLVGVKWSP
jgi:hypothetical protein